MLQIMPLIVHTSCYPNGWKLGQIHQTTWLPNIPIASSLRMSRLSPDIATPRLETYSRRTVMTRSDSASSKFLGGLAIPTCSGGLAGHLTVKNTFLIKVQYVRICQTVILHHTILFSVAFYSLFQFAHALGRARCSLFKPNSLFVRFPDSIFVESMLVEISMVWLNHLEYWMATFAFHIRN